MAAPCRRSNGSLMYGASGVGATRAESGRHELCRHRGSRGQLTASRSGQKCGAAWSCGVAATRHCRGRGSMKSRAARDDQGRLESEVPAASHDLESADVARVRGFVEARRIARDEGSEPAGHLDVCNVNVPGRISQGLKPRRENANEAAASVKGAELRAHPQSSIEYALMEYIRIRKQTISELGPHGQAVRALAKKSKSRQGGGGDVNTIPRAPPVQTRAPSTCERTR